MNICDDVLAVSHLPYVPGKDRMNSNQTSLILYSFTDLDTQNQKWR